MQKEAQYFFDIVGAFVRGETAPPPHEVDIAVLREVCRYTAMEGVCGYMLQPHLSALPPQMAVGFERFFYQTLGVFANRLAVCEQLHEQLLAANIPFAFVKGPVLSALYPVKELRTFGDLDVYVPPSHADALKTFLEANADAVLESDSMQICIRRADVLVEFHFTLGKDVPYGYTALRVYLETAPQHIVYDEGLGYYTLDRTFHTVYLLAHQMRHLATNSPGVRSYMDLAVLCKSGFLPSAETLETVLRPLGILDYVKTAFSLIEMWWGIASPFETMQIRKEDAAFMQQHLLKAGLFARQAHQNAALVAKKGRGYAFLRMLFPCAKYMWHHKRYRALAVRCLPAAYVYRLLRIAICRTRRSAMVAKDIYGAGADADDRRRIYRITNLSGGKANEKE